MLIVQNSTSPANIRHAMVDLIAQDTIELRVASAYVTRMGSNVLLDALINSLGSAAFAVIPKILVTSFDFGLTEPSALGDWLNLENTRVLVAGAQRLQEELLVPERAFHPKMYAFRKNGRGFSMLVGSANLTGRGLSLNTEAAWAQHNLPSDEVNLAFTRACQGTIPLSFDLLATYESLRERHPPPPEVGPEADPVSPPAPVIGAELELFRIAIRDGAIDPASYDKIWIQGEGLQGGSRNQLELPRGAHAFFGFHFDRYDYPRNLTIGLPLLRSGRRLWNDRPLTWHGNNGMERLNLPTIAQGGFDYSDSAVMFRRLPDESFELIVTPWESDLARSWRQASAQNGLLFRLGRIATNRIVGLI